MPQLLGMKGADVETDIWKIRIQLMKPVGPQRQGWPTPAAATASGGRR